MSERKRRTKVSHPVDVIAGRNLHIARTLAGYTQQRLGDEVGLSFQQIQKYENAKNRMSISRAWEFSSILGVSFSAFVDDADDMPTHRTMSGPQFNEWLALYATARDTGQLSAITVIARRIVELCKPAAREASRCQRAFFIRFGRTSLHRQLPTSSR
jgi:transcriptional regulator with XRE-family HTH domain